LRPDELGRVALPDVPESGQRRRWQRRLRQRGVSPDTTERAWAIRSGLSDAVAAWQQKHVEVRAEMEVVSKPAARTLVEMSRRALLVVVGSHGAGGFHGMLLGSTSQQVLHHASAPVAIVRGTGSAAK
jgi:nucleotide-binding universal stress UspA family protein